MPHSIPRRSSVFLRLGDVVLLFAALKLTLALRLPNYDNVGTYVSFLPLLGLWALILDLIGLYEPRLVRDFLNLVRGTLLSLTACLLSGVTYFYLTSPYFGLTPKTHLVLTVVTFHVLLFSFRRAWLTLTDYSALDQRIVFLGDEDHIRAVSAEFTRLRHETGLTPVDWAEGEVDLVVADASWVENNWEQAKGVFLAAVTAGVPIVRLTSFYESVFGKVSPLMAGRPLWALDFVLPRTGGSYARLKRWTDVAGAAVLLALASPFMALIALAVAVCNGRPVLYTQPRRGLLGKTFNLWKFRSMSAGPDCEVPFQSAREETDTRITRLGRVLRRFRLDELPNLWNVLRGDMSLVGPRPEWVKEIAVLEKTVPNYHLRHLVMPGITGWAQVYFRATNNPNDSLEKLNYDLYYVKHFSLALDVTILLKTLKRVFIKDSRVPAAPLLSLPPKDIVVGWVDEIISARQS